MQKPVCKEIAVRYIIKTLHTHFTLRFSEGVMNVKVPQKITISTLLINIKL